MPQIDILFGSPTRGSADRGDTLRLPSCGGARVRIGAPCAVAPLSRGRALSKTAIAERLGLDRSTIHRWIRAGELERDVEAEAVRYHPRPPRPSKLDPYATPRRHATTLERPLTRFERDERAALQPLAPRPYRSLVLLPPAPAPRATPGAVPAVAVERRPLRVYAQLTGGAP